MKRLTLAILLLFTSLASSDSNIVSHDGHHVVLGAVATAEVTRPATRAKTVDTASIAVRTAARAACASADKQPQGK